MDFKVLAIIISSIFSVIFRMLKKTWHRLSRYSHFFCHSTLLTKSINVGRHFAAVALTYYTYKCWVFYYKESVSPMPNATPQRQLLKSIVQLFILQPTKNKYYSFWEYRNKLLEILQFTMCLSMWCELQAKFMNGCLDDKGLKGTNNQRKSVVNEMCEGLEQVPCPILPSFSNSSYSTYIGYKFDESLQI